MEATRLKQVVLYTNGNQECDRIKMLLKSLGGEFLEYELNKDFTIKQFHAEFGVVEFPQVAIDYSHVGGLKETLHYLQDKGLLTC